MKTLLPLALLACAACFEAPPADGGRPDDDDPREDAGPAQDAGPVSDAGPGCGDVASAPPAAPVVVSPSAGALDVVPAALSIALGAYADADGHAHARTEIEVWRVRNGVAADRVWRLSSSAPVTSATLADGAYEGDALTRGGLEPWERHSVRARFAEQSGACDPWSAWSAEVVFRTDDGSAALFDPTVIRTFDLTLPQQTIDALNAEAHPPGCVQFPRTAHVGALTVDGVTFDGVGVRIKGGCGSSRDFSEKPSLKINLSWDDPSVDGCPTERRFLGQKTLTLNNGVQDPSAKHEMMGYRLYRAAGVPAPRVAHAWVRVNGQDYGLYQLIETADRRFLSRFYENNDGMMYEGAYWCDLIPSNVPTQEGEFSCFQREFEADVCDGPTAPGADPMDWELLRGLTNDLDLLDAGGFYPAVRELFDWDEVLSMWAVDAMLSHWDAYSFHIVNNYRVYHDPLTDRFTMTPWGIDQTFEMGGDVNPWDSSARLINACADDAACDAAFATRLRQVVALFEAQDFAAEAELLHTRLAPFVELDPRREYSFEDWQNRHGDLLDWIGWRPQRVRELLEQRGYFE